MKTVVLVLAMTGVASGSPLRSTPMAGPFKTAKAACLAAPACGGTEWNDAKQTITGSPGKAQCSYWPESEPGEPEEAPDETTLATKGALLASVQCASPRGIRHVEERYYLFVETAAGWWRAPAFSFSYNDKYCGEELSATWEARGTRTIARVAAIMGCVACNKQGQQSETLDLLLIADTSRKRPVMYAPLVTGQHERQERDADGATDVECPSVKTDTVLAETWPAPDTLVLSGPRTWMKTKADRRGVLLQLGPGTQRSPAGTYKLD